MTSLSELLGKPVGADLGARIAWIQALVIAVEAEDLGAVGAAVVLDLKASLGAIVAWGRGSRDAESLLHLQALLTALLARATSTLYRALAAQWQVLADDDERAADVAQAFVAAAAAVDAGEEVGAHIRQLLAVPDPNVR